MKRTTALITAAVIALGMTACSKDKDKPAEETSSAAAAASQEENSGTSLSDEEILKKANGCAKTGYNAVAEYLADLETQGKLSIATEEEAAEFAARELGYIDSTGIVGVTFDGDLTESPDFHVLWRENENSGIIGRYPAPPQSPDEQIDWDAAAEMSCYETYYNDDED